MQLRGYKKLVRLAGFEPATLEFVVRYSIQMSYRRNKRCEYTLPCQFLQAIFSRVILWVEFPLYPYWPYGQNPENQECFHGVSFQDAV